MAGGTVVVVVAPAYSGTRRTGWGWWLHDLGPSSNRTTQPTREKAAIAGLAAWERWATSKTNREDNR